MTFADFSVVVAVNKGTTDKSWVALYNNMQEVLDQATSQKLEILFSDTSSGVLFMKSQDGQQRVWLVVNTYMETVLCTTDFADAYEELKA